MSTDIPKPPRVRIAPSPTGDPHVGTAYIGLFNLAFAKQRGGRFILRIEDTDQTRSTGESEHMIFDALKWLGIEWDEGPDCGGPHGPYRQSERLDIYKKHADQLVEGGHAYWCTCSSERLAEVRKKKMEEKASFLGYDGHCRERAPAEVKAELDSGVPGVVRLKTPKVGFVRFDDELRGEIEIGAAEIDDQVLMKSDGFPTYHLANVVDDHLMEITHVIRGEEWISSTPKHKLLYAAFGWSLPKFVHLPLLRNSDKSKVSKRKNPVSLSFFREAGYLPEAMINFLGMMAFTFEDEREIFTLEDFVEGFTLGRVSLGGPVFDMDKLLWLNGRYLRERKSIGEYKDYIKERLFNDAYMNQVVALVQPRVEKAEDFIAYADFFFAAETPCDPALLMLKDKKKKDVRKIWEELVERIDRQTDWQPEKIQELMQNFCRDKELKPKEVFMPVRMMTTGKKASPDLMETMAVLGRERCRQRMRKNLELFKAYKP